MKRTAIAVDFDGVINDNKGIHNAPGEPIPGSILALLKLEDEGYEVIIYSCRPADQISLWLGNFWPRGRKHPMIAVKKPTAVAYIDDRGIRFTNWTDILNHFI